MTGRPGPRGRSLPVPPSLWIGAGTRRGRAFTRPLCVELDWRLCQRRPWLRPVRVAVLLLRLALRLCACRRLCSQEAGRQPYDGQRQFLPVATQYLSRFPTLSSPLSVILPLSLTG